MRTPGPCDDVAAMIREPRRPRPPAGRLALLAALAAALAAPAPAGEPAPLSDRVATAQKLVEKVRGARFRGPVASSLLPEKELGEVLGRKLVEDLPAPFETYAASLVSLGLIEPSPELLPRLARLYTRQVVGFYDPAEKKFFVVPERTRDTGGPAGELMEQLLLAHELTHALQDQRLGLDRRMRSLRDSTDGLLALQAFLEGEATIVMTDALLASVPPEAREALGGDPLGQVLEGLEDSSSVDGSEGVPEFFVKELVFPYSAGTAWVREKRLSGGWHAVDAVYGALPETTREILRPGVKLAPRRRLAPADRPDPSKLGKGCATAWADTLGEWALGLLLERAGAGEEAAKDAAAEWQDDRVVFLVPRGAPAGEGLGFVWRIRASGPAAAARIGSLLAPLYAGRADGARPAVSVRRDVVEVSLPAALPAR
jgi:hypothetical protein